MKIFEPRMLDHLYCQAQHQIVASYLIMILFTEVLEFANFLGINLDTEKHLLYLAREGLEAQLPQEWRPWSVLLIKNYKDNFQKKMRTS